MKLLCLVFLIYSISSCGVRIPEGMGKPVYFVADEEVFTDTLEPKPYLTYTAPNWLYYPCVDLVYLKPGKMEKATIVKPTIFTINQARFLIYPRDRIRVTMNPKKDYSPTFFSLKNRKARDRELKVLKQFEELEKKPKHQVLLEYDYQDVLNLEISLKNQMLTAEEKSQHLFDSLMVVNKVRRKFKKATKDYIKNRYDNTLLDLYWHYKDTLVNRQVYFDKVNESLLAINTLDNHIKLNQNTANHINFLNTSLFPSLGVSSMIIQNRFEECFDTISHTFKGPARDLLLSRLMYHAKTLSCEVSETYKKRYRSFSLNRKYRKIISRAPIY